MHGGGGLEGSRVLGITYGVTDIRRSRYMWTKRHLYIVGTEWCMMHDVSWMREEKEKNGDTAVCL